MKFFICLFSCSFLLFNSCFAQADENKILTKQQVWNQFCAEVNEWVDGIGCPIDAKIKETIVALNVLGISTSSSCEGHLDHGNLFPWIDLDIQDPQVKTLQDHVVSLLQKRDQEEKNLETKYPQLSMNERLDKPEARLFLLYNEESIDLMGKLEQAKKNHFKPLHLLLNQFYQNQYSSYDCMLILSANGRLQSIGGEWQVMRSSEEKTAKLREYQEEMEKFTRFLKIRFFGHLE